MTEKRKGKKNQHLNTSSCTNMKKGLQFRKVNDKIDQVFSWCIHKYANTEKVYLEIFSANP